jgi:hypothetical protein
MVRNPDSSKAAIGVACCRSLVVKRQPQAGRVSSLRIGWIS